VNAAVVAVLLLIRDDLLNSSCWLESSVLWSPCCTTF
ncbi:unnamed protein product, partial [Rotaria sp. Silwood2]